MNTSNSSKTNNWLKLTAAVMGLIALIMIIQYVSADSKSSDKPKKPMTAAEREQYAMDSLAELLRQDTMGGPPYIPPLDTNGKWSIWEREDKMTSKMTKYASLRCNTKLEFDFPYQGGAYIDLTVRKKKNETEAWLEVTKGQFAGRYDMETILVRFDDHEPRKYGVIQSADNSNDIIFIDNTVDFVKRMKASKKMLIQVLFYKEGSRQLEFDTEGLSL